MKLGCDDRPTLRQMIEHAKPDKMIPRGRVDVRASEGVCEVAGDVTLAGVDAQVVRAGLWLAVDGPADAEVGVLVSRDSTGPLRVGFGGWRELVVSTRVRDSRKKVAERGAEVVGSGAEVLSVVCRLAVRPEEAMAVRVHPDLPLADIAPRPQWVVLTRSALWLGYVGTGAEVDRAHQIFSQVPRAVVARHSTRDDAAMRARLWTVPQIDDPSACGLRIHVAPEMFRALVLRAKVFEWVADPWHGTVLVGVPAGRVEAVKRIVEDFGGRVEELG